MYQNKTNEVTEQAGITLHGTLILKPVRFFSLNLLPFSLLTCFFCISPSFSSVLLSDFQIRLMPVYQRVRMHFYFLNNDMGLSDLCIINWSQIFTDAEIPQLSVPWF